MITTEQLKRLLNVLQARGSKIETKPVVFARGFEMGVMIDGQFFSESEILELTEPVDADDYVFFDAEAVPCGRLRIRYDFAGPSYRLHWNGDELLEGALSENPYEFIQRTMATLGATSVRKM